jgi:UDP-N-acetylmuramate dehydrogenase
MVEQLSVTPVFSKSDLLAGFGERLQFDEPMSRYSSFKTGGPARYFLNAQTEKQICDAVATANKMGIPFFLLGGGSNLLVSDDGFDGLVIRDEIMGLSLISVNEIECGAGEHLMSLVNFACDSGLTGFEFAAGIWGSVGGAIFGNAGAYGGEIAHVLTSICLVDRTGQAKVATPDYCRFAYRDSYLKVTREIVTSCRLQLKPGYKTDIRAKIDEILASRATKHPDKLTAGSFFKNIPDQTQPYGKLPAGKLLEEVGAKSLSVGGARVYEKHANIIVSDGTATSREIRQLADIMKAKVLERFGITLEEEVMQVGKF